MVPFGITVTRHQCVNCDEFLELIKISPFKASLIFWHICCYCCLLFQWHCGYPGCLTTFTRIPPGGLRRNPHQPHRTSRQPRLANTVHKLWLHYNNIRTWCIIRCSKWYFEFCEECNSIAMHHLLLFIVILCTSHMMSYICIPYQMFLIQCQVVGPMVDGTNVCFDGRRCIFILRVWWQTVLFSMLSNGDNDGLVQDCNISSALAIEFLDSCTRPSIFPWLNAKEM